MNPHEGKFWVWQYGPNTYRAFDKEFPICDDCGGLLMMGKPICSGTPAEICHRLGPNASVSFFTTQTFH